MTPASNLPRLAGIVCSLAIHASLLGGCATQAPKSAVEDAAATVARLLSGSYASSRQAHNDRSYFDVRLFMRPIWTERRGEHWLYVEQAMATTLDKPYRQRVYRIVAGEAEDEGVVISHVYTLPGDPLHFAGAHANPALLNWLKPENLIEREGCAIYLRQEAADRYVGSTRGKDCSSDLRGARYTTSRVVLWRGLLSSWDRGFDQEDTQVWGAVTGPYEFDRVAE